jgi:hypothetical protein
MAREARVPPEPNPCRYCPVTDMTVPNPGFSEEASVSGKPEMRAPPSPTPDTLGPVMNTLWC